MCCSNKKYKIVMHYFVKCKSYNQANCLTIRAKSVVILNVSQQTASRLCSVNANG